MAGKKINGFGGLTRSNPRGRVSAKTTSPRTKLSLGGEKLLLDARIASKRAKAAVALGGSAGANAASAPDPQRAAYEGGGGGGGGGAGVAVGAEPKPARGVARHSYRRYDSPVGAPGSAAGAGGAGGNGWHPEGTAGSESPRVQRRSAAPKAAALVEVDEEVKPKPLTPEEREEIEEMEAEKFAEDEKKRRPVEESLEARASRVGKWEKEYPVVARSREKRVGFSDTVLTRDVGQKDGEAELNTLEGAGKASRDKIKPSGTSAAAAAVIAEDEEEEDGELIGAPAAKAADAAEGETATLPEDEDGGAAGGSRGLPPFGEDDEH